MPMRKRVLLALGYFNPDLYSGIIRYAHDANWVLNTSMIHYGRLPAGWVGDGMLTFLIRERQDLIQFTKRFANPVVDFSWDVPKADVSHVIPDNAEAGRLAAEHLLERGYRNLAFFQATGSYNIRIREAGFRAAALNAGANYVHWDFPAAQKRGEKNWTRFLETMLTTAPRPLGILAQSDNRAVQLLGVCEDLGLRVPQDLAIVGIDNNEAACELASVPITSVDIDWETLGFRGAKLLDDMLHGRREPLTSPLQIKPKSVITRGSSDTYAVDNPDVSAALSYIWANFRQPISVDDIVDETNVSRCVLYQLFRHYIGRSIAAEINRKRVEAAEVLLTETRKKIRLVAEESGFSSTVHLIRVFGKKNACTPTEFRVANTPEPKIPDDDGEAM